MNPEISATIFFVMVRIFSMLNVLPLFSMMGMPRHVGVLMSVGLALVILPGVPILRGDLGLIRVVLGLISELTIGTLTGYSAMALFSAISLGTEVMSSQMGLNMAAVLNPLMKRQEGGMATIIGWLAGMLFLGAHLHLHFIELIAASFTELPPGSAVNVPASAQMITQIVSRTIALGVQIASPVIAMVWTVNVFTGILGRLAPKMNVFFSVGMTLNNIGGLLLVGVALPWILNSHLDAMVDSLGLATRLLVLIK